MFAFRADSSALYEFECVFSDRFPKFRWPYYFDDTGEIREEYPDGARFVKRVKQWKGLRTHFHIFSIPYFMIYKFSPTMARNKF
jgi:hypothetical protein